MVKAGEAYQSFRLLYVFVPEEELSVQIREVDRVEVNDVDVEEAAEDKVLEELAANAPSANHQDARLTACISPAARELGMYCSSQAQVQAHGRTPDRVAQGLAPTTSANVPVDESNEDGRVSLRTLFNFSIRFGPSVCWA